MRDVIKRLDDILVKIEELKNAIDKYTDIVNSRLTKDCEPQENYLPLSKSQTAR